MKPTVLVPMAGLGSRFVKEGYKVPKQLITVGNKHLIDLSLDCLDYSDCNMVFIVRDEQVYNHHIDEILVQKFGSDIKVIVLDHLTDGSVCSCLYAEEYIDNDAPLLIHTLDVEFDPQYKVIDLLNLESDGLILTFKSNSPNYSYVLTDENGVAVKTAEKKPISDQACVGVYCYKRGSDFVKYAKDMVARNIRTNNEFYISPLYNLFIEAGLKITTLPVEKMHVFGTPDEYNFYKNNVNKQLGDKPIALCSDHSGYDAKELFKQVLDLRGIPYIDFGTSVNKDCDYSDFISQAARAMNENECDYAFGFCRSGQGVNMCANKHKGIRSALIYNEYAMEMAIRHNCANFFSIPAKYADIDQLSHYLRIAMNNSFDGGRHQVRIQNLEK
jgi:RpiB/LacA/LacB family sugar-phosphate isomerase